jgi:hypothetical protein
MTFAAPERKLDESRWLEVPVDSFKVAETVFTKVGGSGFRNCHIGVKGGNF